MMFKAVIETFTKWLLLEDIQAVRLILGTVVANLLRGDPVWLFIIAPPSSSKTELIQSLKEIPEIYLLSSLTPQTFISGQIDRDGSLLPHLNNKILTLKDFTGVLTMHREKQAEILGQLREIYDGHYKKAFGTGKVVKWTGKLGFIAGVTPIIDTHYSIYQVLGERFIQYRLRQPDPIMMAERAMENNGKEQEMRKELSTVVAGSIKSLRPLPEIEEIKIPDEIKRKLYHLTTFCVTGRSGVIRDGYSREITYIPEPEAPARLVKQLSILSYGLAALDNRTQVSEDDYRLLFRIGMDSLPKSRYLVLQTLLKEDDFISTSDIASEIQYPLNTTRRILEELHALKLMEGTSIGQGKQAKWKLSENTINLLNEAKPITLPEMSIG